MNMVNKRNHGKGLKEKVVRKISLRRRHEQRPEGHEEMSYTDIEAKREFLLI